MNKIEVLNFGSLNIDHVYQVPHFVAPKETLSCMDYAQFAGGKGLNQSVALARAGVRTAHAGKIGADGAFLEETLKLAGVDLSTPAPIHQALELFDQLIDQLDELLAE